ncbi:hypothetical protein, partial [Cellulophaga sp. Z1A5H]|uniref:hypothetical protein n=1 Tax=Cellulophaga sp. Z1A5H TaxID=2687291 RepID=UPI001F0E5081
VSHNMKKAIYILTLLLTAVQFANGQEIPIPDNYSIVDSVSGDLDKDSFKELVVAYNTGPENEVDGVPRELVIYKLKNNKWTEWKRSSQALYGSRDGGMMGDPFGEIEIENGILLISQNGGSSWKWGFTDKYRFQDGEFYLIGYSSIAGKLCEYWKDVDFNLSTGKLIIKKEYEECETEEQEIYKRENETLFEKGLKITMQNRQEREIKITTPKYGHEIYIAIGKE